MGRDRCILSNCLTDGVGTQVQNRVDFIVHNVLYHQRIISSWNDQDAFNFGKLSKACTRSPPDR